MTPQPESILVLNAGSSSLKFRVFGIPPSGEPRLALGGNLEELYNQPRFTATGPSGEPLDQRRWAAGDLLGHEGAMTFLFDWLKHQSLTGEISAVGHRVVHGGGVFSAPVRIDEAVVAALEKIIPLAPLHQPHAIRPMKFLAARLPGLPQVACFDTAFHATQPAVASAFALPEEITRFGVRRYGFHGLSYQSIAAALPEFDPKAAAGRTVALHLGNGASMCAILAGKGVASTMSFTALDGLPMGTRCGTIDAAIVLFLMEHHGMEARDIEKMLYHQSGLLGVSGISSDMRTLQASTDPRARLAVDLFIYRIGRELGSLAAALGGLDAIVFTAGIGENDAALRERVCRDAAWLGLQFDPAANAARGPRISLPASPVSAWIIPANEELMIARQTLATR